MLLPFLCSWILDGFEKAPSVHNTAFWFFQEIVTVDLLAIVTLILVSQVVLGGRKLSDLVFSRQLSPATTALDVLTTTVILFFLAVFVLRFIYFFLWPIDQILTQLYGFNPLNRPYPEKALWLFEVIVLGPIYEELIFRGLMRELFKASAPKDAPKAGEWRYVIYSSILFGLCHFEQGISILLTTSILGMIACRIYIRMGYLLPLVVAHGTINAISIGSF